MKFQFRKSLALLLALLICLGSLAACDKKTPAGDGKDTAPVTEAPAPSKPTAPGLEEVVIVRNAVGTEEYYQICGALKDWRGCVGGN